MTERRFNEAEVAAIFERATEAHQTGQRQLPSGEGMTLAQLQEIGREVGISPEQVAEAANSLERVGSPTSRSFLRLPIGVGRTIELDRRLTDDEWDRLVVDLRETFDARGTLRHDGSLKQWTNGNLQVLLEPTATGHRVRTIKGDARSMLVMGLGMMAFAVITAVMSEGGAAGAMSAGTLLALGAGMFGVGALRLPGWARLRRQQMEDIAARLSLAAKSPEQP